MNFNKHFNRITLFALILFIGAGLSQAQNIKFPNPRQEKLLNEFKLLIWSVPEAEKVTCRLRLNKGSAFDQLGKEGQMALLANILFPDQISRDFFEEDLGGSLEITSTYDYLQINVTSDPDQILTVLQTLANAVISPQIDKETTAKVREDMLARVRELENDPVYLADLAVSKRLFGEFPYSRPPLGTSETLPNIDFADLIFAQQRFLTADNATLTVSGNVKSDLIYRAVRRYFGIWTKADEPVPATFRLPETPDKNVQIIESVLPDAHELRFAIRGLARNDKNFYAAEILAEIIKKRLQTKAGKDADVAHQSHFLPGMVLVRFSNWKPEPADNKTDPMVLPPAADNLFKGTVSADEFNSAKSVVLARFANETISELWLDVDTFRLDSFRNDYQRAQNVKLEDVAALAANWAKQPIASVLLVSKSMTSGESTNSVQ